MKHRTTRQTREIFALFVFSALCGRLMIGAWQALPNSLWVGTPGRSPWDFGSPAIALTILTITTLAAVIRIVILLRAQVSHGHCPHCGHELDERATHCTACCREIPRSANTHEKRLHRTRFASRRIAATLTIGMFCVIVVSLEWSWEFHTPLFPGGSGWSVWMENGELIVRHRTPDYFPNKPTPISAVRSVVQSVPARGGAFWVGRNDGSRLNVRLFKPATTRNDAWQLWFVSDSSIELREERRHRVAKAARRLNLKSEQALTYDEYNVTIPLWVPALAFLILAILTQYRHRAFPVGCCQTCGYDLDSVAGPVCPECGTPKHESTYGIPTRWRGRSNRTRTPNA